MQNTAIQYFGQGAVLFSSDNPHVATAPVIFRVCRTPDCKRVVSAWLLYGDLNNLYPCKKRWEDPDMPLPRPYKIREVEGKGHGMVATRKIQRGELILRERPILLFPGIMRGDTENTWDTLEKRLFDVFLYLPIEDKKKFLVLHNCKPRDECGPLTGIARTNALGVCFPLSEINICKQYGAICLESSYCNHSCVLNTTQSWDLENMIFELTAGCDIEAGEEITISYLDIDKPFVERQEELERKYAFTCMCPKCTADLELLSPSDTRKRFVASTSVALKSHRMWQNWLQSKASNEREAQTNKDVETVEAFLSAMDEEGVRGEGQCMRVQASQHCAFIFAYLADFDNFKKWAGRLVKEAKEPDNGEESRKIAEVWQGWVENPPSHPLWGMLGMDQLAKKMRLMELQKSGFA